MKRIASLISAIALFFAVDSFACTTAIISAGASKSGRPLLWKQRDTDYMYNSLRYARGEKYAFIAIVNTGADPLKNSYGGMNEAGLCLVNNVSYNRSGQKNRPDPRNGAFISKALGCCATIDEFEALLKAESESFHVEANFGIIDAKGGAAYFEAGSFDYNRFDVPEGGYLVRSNFSFSGVENQGKGMVRYNTADYLISRKKGKIDAEFLIDGLGRSFYNSAVGRDMLAACPCGVTCDTDLIARGTSVSGICFEGVNPGEAPNSALVWAAVGYTPCCYAVPVWMQAGDNIPEFISGGQDGKAAANLLAVKLYEKVHPFERDAAKSYVDFSLLRPILKAVRKAEKTEFRLGRALDSELRSQFDTEKIKLYNAGAQQRFEAFSSNF